MFFMQIIYCGIHIIVKLNQRFCIGERRSHSILEYLIDNFGKSMI